MLSSTALSCLCGKGWQKCGPVAILRLVQKVGTAITPDCQKGITHAQQQNKMPGLLAAYSTTLSSSAASHKAAPAKHCCWLWLALKGSSPQHGMHPSAVL